MPFTIGQAKQQIAMIDLQIESARKQVAIFATHEQSVVSSDASLRVPLQLAVNNFNTLLQVRGIAWQTYQMLARNEPPQADPPAARTYTPLSIRFGA